MSSSGRRDLLGRRRVAVQVPLGQPHAADVDRPGGAHAVGVPEDELGGTAADVDHQERRPRRCAPWAARRRPARRWRRGRTARPPRRPVITSGACPRVADDHVLEVLPVGRVPGRAGGRPCAPRSPRGPALRRRTRRARRGCARRPPAPADRWRRRPAPAARPPCAGAGRCAAPAAGTSATSRRMELVPQSMAATRVTRRSPRAGRRGRPPTTPPSRRRRGRRSG